MAASAASRERSRRPPLLAASSGRRGYGRHAAASTAEAEEATVRSPPETRTAFTIFFISLLNPKNLMPRSHAKRGETRPAAPQGKVTLCST